MNQRPFRKREGSRASVFAAVERSALRALPAEPFDMSQWSYARVNIVGTLITIIPESRSRSFGIVDHHPPESAIRGSRM